LPLLLSADIGRIPSPTDMDLGKLHVSLADMGTRVEKLSDTVGKLADATGLIAHGAAAVNIAAFQASNSTLHFPPLSGEN
jgi:hypothetical protein